MLKVWRSRRPQPAIHQPSTKYLTHWEICSGTHGIPHMKLLYIFHLLLIPYRMVSELTDCNSLAIPRTPDARLLEVRHSNVMNSCGFLYTCKYYVPVQFHMQCKPHYIPPPAAQKLLYKYFSVFCVLFFYRALMMHHILLQNWQPFFQYRTGQSHCSRHFLFN
jgi:hypothetical protein